MFWLSQTSCRRPIPFSASVLSGTCSNITSKIVPSTEWNAARCAHEKRFDDVLGTYLQNRSRGIKHPVVDFLFEYYNFRPSALRRWSPGIGVNLSTKLNFPEINRKFLSIRPDSVSVDPATLPSNRLTGLRWTVALLESTSQRQPSFGCHGLHEWAMVYRQSDIRHNQFPLRLGSTGTDSVVEANNIVCSHFDAFRFFTRDAEPLNAFELTRQSSAQFEQPGCLHTNMDLYKWAYKFSPWVASDLVLRSFLLAKEIRFTDMAASPYDLTSIGVAPIRIETEAGRTDYRSKQAAFYQQSLTIRQEILSVLSELIRGADKQIS